MNDLYKQWIDDSREVSLIWVDKEGYRESLCDEPLLRMTDIVINDYNDEGFLVKESIWQITFDRTRYLKTKYDYRAPIFNFCPEGKFDYLNRYDDTVYGGMVMRYGHYGVTEYLYKYYCMNYGVRDPLEISLKLATVNSLKNIIL